MDTIRPGNRLRDLIELLPIATNLLRINIDRTIAFRFDDFLDIGVPIRIKRLIGTDDHLI